MTAAQIADPALRPDRAALVALVRSFAGVFVDALRSDPADGAAHALAAQIDIGLALADAVAEEAPPEEVAAHEARAILRAYEGVVAHRDDLARRSDDALLRELRAMDVAVLGLPLTTEALRALPPLRDAAGRAAVWEWIEKIQRHVERLAAKAAALAPPP